jgi:hypothetical protein
MKSYSPLVLACINGSTDQPSIDDALCDPHRDKHFDSKTNYERRACHQSSCNTLYRNGPWGPGFFVSSPCSYFSASICLRIQADVSYSILCVIPL